MSMEHRREMVDREHPTLSVVRQCSLLGVNRSSLYYRHRGASEEELSLMKEMDRQYLETPFYGSRRMKAKLNRQGVRVSRKRVQRLMGLMGLQAIYRRPSTSRRAKEDRGLPLSVEGHQDHKAQSGLGCGHHLHPHGPRLPIPGGGDGLTTARYVAAWRLSNTLEADFCVEALMDALKQGKPEIFNTDQGSQFTSQEFTQVLQQRWSEDQHGMGWEGTRTTSWRSCCGRR